MADLGITYKSKAVKLSQQLADELRDGMYKPGTLLPPETHLANKYKVSRPTVRRAISLLAEKNYLIRQPQRGVLVAYNLQDEISSDSKPTTAKKISISAILAAEPDALLIGIREGISEYAKEHNIEFNFFLSQNGHRQALEIINNIKDYPTDGIIVIPYSHQDYIDALKRLVDMNFPIVCTDRLVGDVDTNSVEVDNAAGMYQATHYLIDKYHRPVHFISAALEHQTIYARYQGFWSAMRDAGYDEFIEQNTHIIDIKDYDPQYWPMEKKWLPGYKIAETLFDNAEFPISIVCINDYAARGVYEAANKHNLVIGSDIAVVGFDDIPMAKLLEPSLTTVRQPRQEIGYQSAKLLHRIIEGKVNPPVHIHLPVELIIRQSG